LLGDAESKTSCKVIIKRKPQFTDAIRSYHILIDDVEAGKISIDETVEFCLSPGNHSLKLELDWMSSNIIELTIEKGEIVKLECGCNTLSAIFPFVAQMFNRKNYLYLMPEESNQSL
jgi:hypothetical protein